MVDDIIPCDTLPLPEELGAEAVCPPAPGYTCAPRRLYILQAMLHHVVQVFKRIPERVMRGCSVLYVSKDDLQGCRIGVLVATIMDRMPPLSFGEVG